MTCPPTHRTKKEMLKYFCAWLDLIKNFSYKGGTVAVGSAAQIVPILCSTYPPPPSPPRTSLYIANFGIPQIFGLYQ